MSSKVYVDSIPFTDDSNFQWSGDLGPVWLIPPYTAARLQPDKEVSLGLHRFIESVLSIAGPMRFAYGTAYATYLNGEPVPAGELHYDGGERDPDRNVARFAGTWASDEFPLANMFMHERDEEVEALLAGSLVDLAPAEALFQPANNLVVQFDEGLDLHGRAPAASRPGHWGIFCSATLYLEGQAADLHCPRLGDLAGRAPEGVPLLSSTVRSY